MPGPLDRILIPLDGSSLGEAVLAQCRSLMKGKGCEVTLLRAVPSYPDPHDAPFLHTNGHMEREANEYLLKIAEGLKEEGIPVKILTRIGLPGNEILDVAEELSSSLIAMTSHGRSGLRRWVYGSVTEKVLRASTVPVLVMRSFSGTLQGKPDLPAPTELSIRSILVPLDGSGASETILPLAIDFARVCGASLHLLRVLHPALQKAEAEPYWATVRERFGASGVDFECRVESGDPAAAILDTCDHRRPDLLAMSTHGRSGMSRWVFGSVAEKVLRSSQIPVLTRRSPLHGVDTSEPRLKATADR